VLTTTVNTVPVSDGWVSYLNIHAIGDGIYTHDVIVHDRHFVDPTDEEIHTQNIENMWMRAKCKLRRQFGTSRALFPSYIHEFVFRTMVKDMDVFAKLLKCVGKTYPV